MTSGLIWMAVLMFQVSRRGLTSTNRTRILCLSLFWHFLDAVSYTHLILEKRQRLQMGFLGDAPRAAARRRGENRIL